VEKGKLLTLTTEGAIKHKLAKKKVSNLLEILEEYHLASEEIITLTPNWAEEIVRFLTHPIVSSLLLTLGLLGLLIEFRMPGWGIPGTVGVISLILFFWGHYLVGLAGWEELIIFIIGVILLGLEIFVIPGFGIAGISGIILILISLLMALISKPFTWTNLKEAISILTSSFVAVFFLFLIFLKFLPQTKAGKRFILATVEDRKAGFISASEKFHHLVGKEGISLTPLRPTGKALIEGEKIEVLTEGEYIEPDQKVKVIRVEGNKVFVSQI
jgi:membrane-bound serine protease (ClpP class)